MTTKPLDLLFVDGVVVVPDLVPHALVQAACSQICAFVGAELDRPETWYAHQPLDWSVVPIHHPQAFWEIRQHPGVHALFARLLGVEKLWVSMDRGIFKVPRSEAHPNHADKSILHWDLDPRVPRSPSYGGMLYLTDTPSEQGAFACVPGLFRDLEGYLARHPGLDLEAPIDVEGHELVRVAVKAGDLVLWDVRLPHHGGPNVGAAPRVSMAITMYPEGSDEDREERVACWRERRPPAWWRNWRGQVDPEPGAPADLTPLGRKLVGIDRW